MLQAMLKHVSQRDSADAVGPLPIQLNLCSESLQSAQHVHRTARKI